MAVLHNVKLIPQGGDKSCWFACFKMMMHWGGSWAAKYADSIDDSAFESVKDRSTLYSLAHMVGMKCDPGKPGAYTRKDVLGKSPAIWVGRSAAGSIGGAAFHAVVLTGYEEEGSNFWLHINDPFPKRIGQQVVFEWNQLDAQLQFERWMYY